MQVGNSSFSNCSTSGAAGGAITIAIASGNGAAGVGDSLFSGNVAVVGGAISAYDGNETNTATIYLQGNTFGEGGRGGQDGGALLRLERRAPPPAALPTARRIRVRPLPPPAACNAAIAGVGNAVNNGDTKGGAAVRTLLSITNNFAYVKGCAAQTVLGPCEGDAGQCPDK